MTANYEFDCMPCNCSSCPLYQPAPGGYPVGTCQYFINEYWDIFPDSVAVLASDTPKEFECVAWQVFNDD